MSEWPKVIHCCTPDEVEVIPAALGRELCEAGQEYLQNANAPNNAVRTAARRRLQNALADYKREVGDA